MDCPKTTEGRFRKVEILSSIPSGRICGVWIPFLSNFLHEVFPMSNASDSPETQGQPQDVQPRQVTVDDSRVIAMYSNFCRVMGTPEEMIIDFGLNPQPYGPPPESIRVDQRIIVNFYTAKRLFAALQMTLQRYEGAFGVIETNVQNRVVQRAAGAV
jgi:hypothetical protein